MGVFPIRQALTCKAVRLPHARGGVSRTGADTSIGPESSPRPWGCFQKTSGGAYQGKVFPTPVGVFLPSLFLIYFLVSLPHARGGVSRLFFSACSRIRSSPRPWGCFFFQRRRNGTYQVFPTPVGVFRQAGAGSPCSGGLPHARGGVSLEAKERLWQRKSSPRPWGCFSASEIPAPNYNVFPTPVGVFLDFIRRWAVFISLPHARGGVSTYYRTKMWPLLSSPRPWGCFYPRSQSRPCTFVFPTPVGVFPIMARRRRRYSRLPHARGGVSPSFSHYSIVKESSPRPWGCFSRRSCF